MTNEFSFQDKFPFLNFQICWNTNHEILIEIVREQFLYQRSKDSSTPLDTFNFYIELIEDSKDDASWNTAMQHRYDPISNILYLSYLNNAISVNVDYKNKSVSAKIMERALSYKSAIGNWVLTIPLSELLKIHGYYLMHAACMVQEGKGVLFAGRSGVGKTTLALGLLSMGWQLVSDDEIFLIGGQRVVAYGGPEKAKVNWQTWKRFSYYLGEQSRFNGKRMISLEDHFPKQILDFCDVSAICFVNQSDRISICSLDQIDVYRRLLSVAFLTSEPEITQNNSQFLYTLCRKVPAYSLSVNLDFKALHEILLKSAIFSK